MSFEETKHEVIAVHEELSRLNDRYMKMWNEEIFLSWRWWLVVAVLVLPWVLWCCLRKKQSTDRLIYTGLSVYLMTSILDSIGVSFGLWSYLVTPFPYLQGYFIPWELTVFPVITMLLIEYKRHISKYVKAAFFAFGSALLAEPFFEWIGIYQTLTWEHYYGIPLYYVIYLIADFVSRRTRFEQL